MSLTKQTPKLGKKQLAGKNDGKKSDSVTVSGTTFNNHGDSDGDGRNIQISASSAFNLPHSLNKDDWQNNIIGSDIVKDEKTMKNICNYLLNQQLKRKRQESDVQFKGRKFGRKKLSKQQRLEKIAKLRKQQIKKMRSIW